MRTFGLTVLAALAVSVAASPSGMTLSRRQTSSCPVTCGDLVDSIQQCGPSGSADADNQIASCVCDGSTIQSSVNECYHCGSPGLTSTQQFDVSYLYGVCSARTANPTASSHKSVPVGAIVGGVLGGLVAVSLIVAGFTWIILLRRQRRVERHEMMPSPQLGPRNQAFVKFPDEEQQHEPKGYYQEDPRDSFDLHQQPSRPPPTIHEEDEEAAR